MTTPWKSELMESGYWPGKKVAESSNGQSAGPARSGNLKRVTEF